MDIFLVLQQVSMCCTVIIARQEESTIAEQLENPQLDVSDGSDCRSREFEKEEFDDGITRITTQEKMKV